jgi:hypothetical protein
VAAVARSGVVVLNNDELSGLDLFTGNKLWNVTGFRNASFVHDGNLLIAFKPASGEIVQLDLRDGMILSTIDAQQKGWLPMATIGKRWLFSPERSTTGDRASEMRLRLVDPGTAQILLEREHTPDTRLALVGDVGVATLKNDGQFVYWNIDNASENVYSVDVEGKFGVVTAQVFGDRALILPYAGSMELEKIVVNPSPRNDPSVAACAGRLFAISTADGKPIWERSQRVKHFLFPISQSRNSPAAIFLRRLSLTKVRGQNLDFTSMAMLDVKTGRLLFQKHDMRAVRGDAFRQRMIPSENSMVIKYLGNTITAHWTGEPIDSVGQEGSPEIGELDPDTFRGQIERQLDDEAPRDLDPEPSKPGQPFPNGEPK